MNLKDVWVAEYSRSQDCFHIDTIDHSIKMNLENVLSRKGNDYLPFFVGTDKECGEAIDKVRACWKDRGFKNEHTYDENEEEEELNELP